MIEHGGARFADLCKKTHVPGLGRQTLDKVVFTLAVFFRQWPDQHMAAVLQRFDPVLSSDRGIGSSGPVIVVFDSEHSVTLHPV
ncbi:hypothetical protein D3C80_1558020 [compost metagenome]